MSEFKKITMNMSGGTLNDIQEIQGLSHEGSRTAVVAKALRAYKSLLEMQEKENKTLLTEDEKGNKERLKLI